MAAAENEMDGFVRLEARAPLKISGADAESFLQNIVTQDVAGLREGELRYGCLLTPQGRFLHDFFIFRDGADFILEGEAARMDDLIRRLKMFRLRAKVDIGAADFAVYAGAEIPKADFSFADPRLPEMGFRSYLPVAATGAAGAPDAYKDRRIRLGVPEGGVEIKPEIDTISDVSLDRLGAVSWRKGCFVGQEVTARMKNRGLAKKRLAIVAGRGLVAGAALVQAGVAVGEVRAVNAAGGAGLAVLRLAAAEA
ncbi:MAG: folate-binding protein, partial [Alphaproteobacteria bacterium]|nr:folate-binding protein [Alphaproteobacteria bacterium]